MLLYTKIKVFGSLTDSAILARKIKMRDVDRKGYILKKIVEKKKVKNEWKKKG